MAEYIIKTDKNGKKHIKVKFHNQVQHFKRIETFKYGNKFYNIYVDKNNNVHNIEESIVTSWKEITKGKRKIRIPDVVDTIPQPTIMNIIRGNTFEVAIRKIMAELEKVS